MLLGALGALGYNLYESRKILPKTETNHPTKAKTNVPTLTAKIYQGEVIYIKFRGTNSGVLEILDNGNKYEIDVDESETKIYNQDGQLTNLSYIKNGFIIKVTQSSDTKKMIDETIGALEIRIIGIK